MFSISPLILTACQYSSLFPHTPCQAEAHLRQSNDLLVNESLRIGGSNPIVFSVKHPPKPQVTLSGTQCAQMLDTAATSNMPANDE